jgi:hypothetical protein
MATLAGSVSIDAFGVATGSGSALALYTLLIATPTYANIVSMPGVTTATLVAVKKQVAETCNVFSTLSDAAQWILTAIKTTNYNAALWELVLCNPTGAGVFITLPNATTALGVSVRIKNVTTSTNGIVVNTFGGVIDGVSTFTLNLAGQCCEFTSDGTNWWITAKFA